MKDTQVDFTGQHVYVGLDVAKRSWKVSVLVGELFHKRFSQQPDCRTLANYLRRNFPGAEYHCVYDAGYCGFWSSDFDRQIATDSVERTLSRFTKNFDNWVLIAS